MPSKIRDASPERRRSSTRKEKETPKSEKPEERKHRRLKHRSSTKDKTSSRTSLSPSTPAKKRTSLPGMIESENMAPPAPASLSKSSLPYPSFSKAHSKEAVTSRPVLNILTPPSTDLNASKTRLPHSRPPHPRNAPPSPPLTDQNAGRPKSAGQPAGQPVKVETIEEEDRKEASEKKIRFKLRPQSPTSDGRMRSSSEVGSEATPMQPRFPQRLSTPCKTVDGETPQRSVSQPSSTAFPAPTRTATETATNISSDATSIAPEQPSIQRPGSKIPPAVAVEDAPSDVTSAVNYSRRQTPLDVFVEHSPASVASTPAPDHPPPPPPPPVVPISIPRVDYLLQHGGLNQGVPRNLLLAGKPMVVQHAAQSPAPPVVTAHLFDPYIQLLDSFDKVMTKNGSLAVATGYRSVARRLLDRLEQVFARDISSEECQCCMCVEGEEVDDRGGVSWGEVLELVSGRRDLPTWPPFSFVASPIGLGISLEKHVPMQKLDIDVPEEYRDHYIRQSKKTKQSVDRWLNRQTDTPTSPPEEVDDETLTFAILTHLESEHRPTLTSLLGIVQGPIEPPRRIPTPELGTAPRPPPTPQPRLRPEPIIVAGEAIQRLYKLSTLPRDAETALFLLNNPTLHNALATLAAISNDEWDILISGRFDGFLRSGAEDTPELSRYPQSRGPTPAHTNGHSRTGSYPSRTTTPATPAHRGAPIALDEETEIATIAEIERDIYTGMEALEDAFEALHLKAEIVRRALRERSAGLAATQQRRRGLGGSNVEVRMGTPASNLGEQRWDMETDDGLGEWDAISEIAPDDSASNVSSSRRRRRRPERRTERRTPALIEEDEDDAESEGTASPKKR